MARGWIASEAGSADGWTLAEVEVPAPAAGQVTIHVHAAGVNPADAKHVAADTGQSWPVRVGYEVSGVLTAIGPSTSIASGTAAVGDEVVAFRVQGGYATDLTIAADKVFAKPAALTHPEAANLLLVGTTAAEMLAVTAAQPGETVLLHAASGSVGLSVLQQAALRGIRVIGSASPERFDAVRRFGGIPVGYGSGLARRVRDAAGDAIVAAALDAAGTDEAIDVSLHLVSDPERIVTIANPARARRDGIRAIRGSAPESAQFRDAVRADLIALAAMGRLAVPVARTYPLEHAREALRMLAGGHPGGKLALIP